MAVEDTLITVYLIRGRIREKEREKETVDVLLVDVVSITQDSRGRLDPRDDKRSGWIGADRYPDREFLLSLLIATGRDQPNLDAQEGGGLVRWWLMSTSPDVKDLNLSLHGYLFLI